MKRCLFMFTVITFLFSCSRFSWESRGEIGEKCFDNGTCTEGFVCVDNICTKPETDPDEDNMTSDNETDDDQSADQPDDQSDDQSDEVLTESEDTDDETVIIPDEDDEDVIKDPTYYDDATGYTWQVNYSPATFTWDEAVGHCNALIYAGFDDWRLPSISDLRTLVSGCSATDSTGGCNVKDECLDYGTCRNEPDCNGCEYGKGPSQYKCYFSGIEGSCITVWSSSTPPAPYSETHGWYMDFSLARISTDEKTRAGTYYAICVR